mgnify:CR=1 FL=1
MRHEVLKPKIPQLHFKPESIVTEDDAEFFDELLIFLESKGYKPDELLYSGFDGEPIVRGIDIPRPPCIFAMNVAGWREALRVGEANPAVYAFGSSTVPVLGLYERKQLALARPHYINQDKFDYNKPVDLGRIEKWEDLSELPVDAIVEETVVHKDFPEGFPADALVGLVFLDRD